MRTLARSLLVAACIAALLAAPAAGATREPARAVSELWTARGTGFVTEMEIGDLDGDGGGDLVVGGRGVLALAPSSPHNGWPRWTSKWPDGAALTADDNSFAKALLLADVTGDDVPDALVGGDEGLYAFDGRSGEPVWRNTTETTNGGHNVAEAAGGDFNGDGVTDVVVAHFLHDRLLAVDGRDGSDLWSYPRPGRTGDMATVDANGDGSLDVVQVGANFAAGPDVHVVSGLGAADTGVATPLWTQEFPGGDPVKVAIGQVVAGGSLEVVVGGFAGDVVVYDAATGLTLASWKHVARVADVVVTDLDGDGAGEVVVANGYEDDGGSASSVEAFRGDGTRLWSYDAPSPPADLHLADLDGDGGDEVVAGGGWRTFGGRTESDGFVTALGRSVSTPAILWEHPLPTAVGVLRAGEVFGERVVLAGHDPDGGVRALAHDGTQRWTYRTGGQARALAAVEADGDARSEVVEGTSDSAVVLRDDDGTVRWQQRLPGVGGPDPVTIASGDLFGSAAPDVVVGTFEYGRGPGGRVHAFSLDRGLQWSYDAPGGFGEVVVDDLDGDGANDVVAGAGGVGLSGEGAQVARLDRDGNVVWEQVVPPSLGLFVDVHDANRDGVRDVVVGTSPLGQSYVLALDGRSGDLLWQFAPEGILWWVEVSPAGDAIATGDSQGHVDRLDPQTGALRWRTKLDGKSRAGAWVADATGDGAADVVSGTAKGSVAVLDGESGAIAWTSTLNPGDEVSAVTGLDGPGRARVAAGSTSNTNGRRGGTYLFDARTGGRLAKQPTEHHVEVLLAADIDERPGDELLSGAGWQLHALAPTYSASTGGPPARAELDGQILGSNPLAPFTTGVTEAAFLRECAVPASQGADGFVFTLPPALHGKRGTATIDATTANGFPAFTVGFYSASCARLDRVTSHTVTAVPEQTRFVVVTAASGTVTTVALDIVADE